MTDITLHRIQKLLLKKLAGSPTLHFKDLTLPHYESEHMNYHLQKLLDSGLVNKVNGTYELSAVGKDYVNRMDDEIKVLEKQPKTSVLLRILRQNPQTGTIEHLVCRRLRQPYFGKIGLLTGKVQFGETLEQAALREMWEETGLTAEHPILEQVYNKLRFDEAGTCVQDVLFYRFFILEPLGNLITETDVQQNFWLSNSELQSRTDLDVHDDFVLDDRIEPEALSFVESKETQQGY
jgi:8-oxo-dGTP diphosphatase